MKFTIATLKKLVTALKYNSTDRIVCFVGRSLPTDIFYSINGDIKDATRFEYFKIKKLPNLRNTSWLNAKEVDLMESLQFALEDLAVKKYVEPDFFTNFMRTSLGSNIAYSELNRVQLYKIVTTDLKVPENWFEKIFGEIPGELESTNDVKIGNSILYFPESAKDKNKQMLVDLVEGIYDILKSKGLKNLFSGAIRFVPSMGNTLGQYDITSKNINISYKASNTDKTKLVVLHEYGHKYYYEDIPDKHDAIKNKFWDIRKGNSFENKSKDEYDTKFISKVKKGDIFTYQGRKRKFVGDWKVVKVGDNKISVCDPNDSKEFVQFIAGPTYLSEKGWKSNNSEINKLIEKGKSSSEPVDIDTWFPTKYSEKDHVEWFAELFSYALGGLLKGDAKKFIDSLL